MDCVGVDDDDVCGCFVDVDVVGCFEWVVEMFGVVYVYLVVEGVYFVGVWLFDGVGVGLGV